jgi:hypothetical protein
MLVAGGRCVAFDTPVDASVDAFVRVCDLPIGHDEDGDGDDDACEGCPQLPSRPVRAV